MKFDILKRPVFYDCDGHSFYDRDGVDKWLDQLYEVLGKAKVVYAHKNNIGNFGTWSSELQDESHKALLIGVEPIEKKECEHKPKHYRFDEAICECGKKLKAKWEVIE